ncbi:MAG TPA: hypothetical protein VKA06_04985 [Spirochaetia bacterium]|nr:hypothetical protein [Spirochaetia bacterium]
MKLRARLRRRRVLSSGLQTRMVRQFLLTVVLSVFITMVGIIGYYWISFAAGENQFREFVIVYQQFEQVETVEVGERMVERRGYTTEALPETSRLALIAPPLLINNLIIGIVLSILAVQYSNHFAGPVYRMSVDIRRVLAGEAGVRIQLRKGDEMTELAQRLNALLEALELAESRAREE